MYWANVNGRFCLTSTAEARIFLSKTFGSWRANGGWRRLSTFLRLPAKLRMRIYELVFAFSCSGIRLDAQFPFSLVETYIPIYTL